MSVTFVPADEEALSLAAQLWPNTLVALHRYIKVLIIDESGPGVEIRIMSDGEVVSTPLEKGVEHYRASPLWVEVEGG